MSGGGGGGTQTVRTELDPAMRPFVEYGLNEAQRLYQQGPMQYYPGQTYVSPSQMTQAGMEMAQQRALAGSPLVQQAQQTVGAMQTAGNPALEAFGDVYQRAGYNPAVQGYSDIYQRAGQMPSAGAYQDIYQRAGYNPSAELFSQVAGGAGSDYLNQARANQLYQQAAMGDPSAGFYGAMQQGAFQNAAMPGTSATAGGAYLGGNPFFQGAFAPAARQAQDVFERNIQNVTSQASQAGRYGSGAMGQLQDRAAGQFAQSLSDVAGQLAYQNYAAERGMQEAAMGRLGALSQQDVANRLTGAQGLSGAAQQTLANQMAAMQASSGLSQQALANRMAAGGALSDIYGQGIQSQLAAAGGLTGAEQAALQTQLAATGGISGALQNALQTQLAAATGLGSTAEQVAGRQLQAAGMAPAMAAQDYADIQRLIDLGQMQEGYQEMALTDAMNRFNFGQAAPYQALQSYLSSAYGAPMGQQVSQPIYRNQIGSAISGGLAGYGLAPQNYGALGAAAGAAAGGLLG